MKRLNLRRLPRVCYSEPEEPSLDEYVFCEKCGDFVFEYCSIHGPLLVVPDDKVPPVSPYPPCVPRAALTIPHVFLHIAPSTIPGAGLGVFSTLTLPTGVRFGPYCGRKEETAKSMYCWQIRDRDNKMSHVVDASDANASNWMRYVNCSRHWIEQNLIAYQYQGKIYYRTIKIIPRFTELMVFYGGEYGRALSLDLRAYNSPPGLAQQYGQPAPKKRKAEQVVKPIEPKPSSGKTENGSINETAPRFRCRFIYKKLTSFLKTENEKVSNNKLEKDNQTDKLKLGDENNNIKDENLKGIRMTQKKSDKSNLMTVLDNRNRSYVCEICNKRFAKKKILTVHLRIHTKEKPYSCEICQKRFTVKCSLTVHIRLHSGVKPYSCEICQKRFTVKCSLTVHIRLHSGVKPYSCEICNRTFTQKSTLTRHLRTH